MFVTCFIPNPYVIPYDNTLLKIIWVVPQRLLLKLMSCDHILLWHWMPISHLFRGPKPELSVCLRAVWQ